MIMSNTTTDESKCYARTATTTRCRRVFQVRISTSKTSNIYGGHFRSFCKIYSMSHRKHSQDQDLQIDLGWSKVVYCKLAIHLPAIPIPSALTTTVTSNTMFYGTYIYSVTVVTRNTKYVQFLLPVLWNW